MSTNLKEDLLLGETVGLMRYSVWQWQGREIGCGKTTLSLSLSLLSLCGRPETLLMEKHHSFRIVCPILGSSAQFLDPLGSSPLLFNPSRRLNNLFDHHSELADSSFGQLRDFLKSLSSTPDQTRTNSSRKVREIESGSWQR